MKSIEATADLFQQQKGIYVILPAYNEEKTLDGVMKELVDLGVNLIVVDDGSTDNTYCVARGFVKRYPSQVSLYRHPLNRGLGGALRTGIKAAIAHQADIIVTFDADGQHHSQDIIPLCLPLINGAADVVIGKRNFQEMPFRKKFGNVVMNIITLLFYGRDVEDSQSGLRAFSNEAAGSMELHSRDYGISSEIIGEVQRKKLRLVEVPITTIYTDYSLSKGTNTSVGLKILAKLIRNIFK
ncbi:glycosyltransferase family 2 protein [Methanobacterium sp. BAmetb5]|uniref:glycosyltransferase family 2 protein n=1 Tax=Methanobacterium sp. BAmetb5 TaxID=2025351 RepID=UPI0025EA54E4|nr:glycosyltransferase family 2 protein [Methanobacterium sp. BAmetb5]